LPSSVVASATVASEPPSPSVALLLLVLLVLAADALLVVAVHVLVLALVVVLVLAALGLLPRILVLLVQRVELTFVEAPFVCVVPLSTPSEGPVPFLSIEQPVAATATRTRTARAVVV
jgi:hypothetical protein